MAKSEKERLWHTRYNRSFKGRYRALKKSAKGRKLSLRITLEEYVEIIKDARCFYCKDLIKESAGYSLDRINTSKGYMLNNVVPCCTECNGLKSANLSFEEMIYIAEALKIFKNKFNKRKKKS